MNILIILKYIPNKYSYQKSDLLYSIIDGHKNDGHDVLLFTTGSKCNCNYKVIKNKINLFNKVTNYLFNKTNNKYKQKTIYQNIIKEHKKKRIDLILAVCTANHPAIHAMNIKKITNIPYLIQEHKTYERTIKDIKDINNSYLNALNEANKIIAVSPELAKTMKKIGIKKNIEIIPNSIPNEFFIEPEKNKKN